MATDQETIMHRAVNAVPSFAWGLCGVMIVFSMSCRIAGVDFEGPVNAYFAAQVEDCSAEVEGELENRVVELESKAHSPGEMK